MAAVFNYFFTPMDQYFIFGNLSLLKPDSDRSITLESFISENMGNYTVYFSHLAFWRPASISDPHDEIITFLPKKVAILGGGFYGCPLIISMWLPFQN